MGTSGSKPDWYPGEPADVFKSDPCLCSQAPQPAGKMGEEADARSPGPFRGSGGGIRALKASPQRDITSLPVVSLTDMQYIANGAFCAVYACKYRGWSVVAKRVRHDLPLSERKAALANLWTEYDCLRNLRHPNVIDVYGMCRVRCRDDYDDWNEKDVCLLVEQLAFGTVGHLFGTIVPTEKNLASAMARSRKMKMVPFRCRLHRALELAQALEYMHGGSGMGSMMHRDIKSVNVGFAQNGSLKLMDFGLSKKTPAGSAVDDTYKMTGEVGSYRYMAPELVKHEPYNSKVDIYSWAILSWEMLAIDKPYSGIGESTFVKVVTSALDEVGGGSRGRCSGSAGGEDRKGSLETIVAGTAHGGRTRREGADVDDIDVDAQEGAPEWTTSAADAAAAAAAAAAIRADVGGGCGDGRRCQLRQALISQRELITDALARETEGLLSSDGPARASSPRAAETTTSTKAAPEPVAEGRRNPDKPRKTGDGSGKGEDTPGGLSSSSSGSSSGSSCSSSAAGSQTAAKTRKVSPTAPAATVAEKAARGAPVVPDVLRESRRNSGLGKLWPSTSSSGRRQDQGDAADAASAAEEEEVGAPPRAVTPGAVWVNGGGIGLPIGKAATATVSSE
eukprot:g6544.t1